MTAPTRGAMATLDVAANSPPDVQRRVAERVAAELEPTNRADAEAVRIRHCLERMTSMLASVELSLHYRHASPDVAQALATFTHEMVTALSRRDAYLIAEHGDGR